MEVNDTPNPAQNNAAAAIAEQVTQAVITALSGAGGGGPNKGGPINVGDVNVRVTIGSDGTPDVVAEVEA